jgi:hypothetical protein
MFYKIIEVNVLCFIRYFETELTSTLDVKQPTQALKDLNKTTIK